MVREKPVISVLLSADFIIVPMKQARKKNVLDSLVEMACTSDLVVDCADAHKAVRVRERQMSTGVGRGLAIPHARTDAVTGTIAVMGILEEPIEYDALDGEPVQLVFLLLGPRNDTSRHIQILSRVSRLMSNDTDMDRLLKCKSSQEALSVLVDIESALLSA